MFDDEQVSKPTQLAAGVHDPAGRSRSNDLALVSGRSSGLENPVGAWRTAAISLPSAMARPKRRPPPEAPELAPQAPVLAARGGAGRCGPATSEFEHLPRIDARESPGNLFQRARSR